MPRALQTIAGFATAAGAGTNVVTPAPGDSFNVPSFDVSSRARLNQVYANGATTDFVRLRSPRMHDANQGLRLRVGATKNIELLPWDVSEVLYPSDTPIVEIDATGAGSGTVLVHYEFDDLPGVNPRLAGVADIASRVVHIMGCEVDVTSGVIGAWGNGVALNANFDNFEAGADYALLGYDVNTACSGIAVTGKDTGNLKIGGPGVDNPRWTANYFVNMSEITGRPCIPIIAANNKSSTLLQNVDVAAATASKVTLLLAQLA
jgi:hypothetical protein